MTKNETIDFIKKSFELKNQGFYKPAIEMLYKALTIESDNPEILTQLGHLYFLLGNLDRAIHYTEQVLDKDINNIDCLKLLKEIYLKQNKFNEAANILEKIFAINPTNDILCEKIKVLSKTKKIENLKKLENLDFKFDDNTYFEFAKAYHNRGEINTAENYLLKALAINSDNIQALELLAGIYFDTNRLKESKELFTKLKKINPTAEVYNYLGLFDLENSKITSAIKNFTKAYESNELNAQYSFNLAHAYFLNGWIEESIKLYNKAICLSPQNDEYRYALGYLFFKIQDFDKAENELSEIKNYAPAEILKSLIKARKGDLLNAKNDLEDFVEQFPNDDFALKSLAEIYNELSYFEKAKNIYLKLIELKPEDLDYKCDLAQNYVKSKDYENATEILENIIKTNKKYIEAYVLEAAIAYEMEDCSELFDLAQEIIELDSNYWKGYYYNALALFGQKDIDFAIESLKKAITLDVNNSTLFIRMGEFYQAKGDCESALQYIQEAANIDTNADNLRLYKNMASLVRKSKNLPSKQK